MLDHINTIEQLEKEAKEIDEFLNLTCSEQPEEALERGNDLLVYLARSGKMLSDAKYWQDQAKKESILNDLQDKLDLSPSIFKELLQASLKRENYLVNWVERINRTCVHQIDFLRTIVSYAKNQR